MPELVRNGVSLHYEEHGEGFPLLAFAPGGMRASIEFWGKQLWHPIAALSSSFRVIAFDQRNAGRSRAPVHATDGWDTYLTDHLALLDHLGVERCHVIGGCIGCAYALKLMEADPGRVVSAVLQNPIGLHDNRAAFWAMFDGWAQEIAASAPNMSEDDWRTFRANMYGGDFVYSVSRDFVRGCETPMLVLCGDDLYHPTPISREIVALAPNAELCEGWKQRIPETIEQVRAFLEARTPR